MMWEVDSPCRWASWRRAAAREAGMVWETLTARSGGGGEGGVAGVEDMGRDLLLVWMVARLGWEGWSIR